MLSELTINGVSNGTDGNGLTPDDPLTGTLMLYKPSTSPRGSPVAQVTTDENGNIVPGSVEIVAGGAGYEVGDVVNWRRSDNR